MKLPIKKEVRFCSVKVIPLDKNAGHDVPVYLSDHGSLYSLSKLGNPSTTSTFVAIVNQESKPRQVFYITLFLKTENICASHQIHIF